MEFVDENKYKNLSGIYKIRQLSSGVVYIGQTKMKFIKRYWHHVWKLNNNTHDNKHMQNCWNKYGSQDFVFEIIHTLNKDVDMNNLEIQYIKDYGSFENGFNMTTGGDGKKNCPTSEHAKKIIGKKNRIHNLGKKASEATKTKMSASQKGRIITDENKEKLRASRLGVKWSEEHKKKLSQLHMGSQNAVSIINEDIATIIKQRLIQKHKVNDIANDLNINNTVVRAIQRSKVWSHVKVNGWDEHVVTYNDTKQKLLANEQVLHIRHLLSQGMTANQVSETCKVGVSVVYGIKQNRTYKDVI